MKTDDEKKLNFLSFKSGDILRDKERNIRRAW